MRVKFTIAVCALLVLALGASQAYAQSGGYDVLRAIETVVQHGKNQMVGQIQLHYDSTGGVIDAGSDITVTFGGLPIAVDGMATCTNGVSCGGGAALNDDKDTITIETTGTPNANELTITLMGVRVDVSSLDAGDEIVATISTTAPSGLIPVGQSRRGSIAAAVGEVKAGLVVEIDAASRLICALDSVITDLGADGVVGGTGDDADTDTPTGGIPMITVSEGFDDAWEEDAIGDSGTVITIATLNLPDGVELRWPETVMFNNPADDDDTLWATLTLSGDSMTQAMVGETSDEDNDGSMVTYDYSIDVGGAAGAGGVMDSFAIPITIVTGDIASGAGGIADIWAILSPQPADDDANIGTVLSYVKDAVTDPETVMGDFLNIAECVTYLLFPYITCGAHPDWDTGIAIANTTMDEGIFGLSAGATAQRGSVTMYAFPTGKKTDDYSTEMGYTGEPAMTMLSGGLAAGDSLAMNCSGDPLLAGIQGYAIVKAGFRHAHGMAFVQNMASGEVDAVHGYIALVIPDPEFGGMNADRAAAEGEVLGH